MNYKELEKFTMPLRRFFIVFVSVALLWLALSMSGMENVLARLAGFPLPITVSLLVLLMANLFLVSFRFWRVLTHFGIILPWQVASRASISGHVAGLFMISLFGQVMGRQAILQSFGIKSVVISGLAAYERVILLLVSGILCLLGATYLLGQMAIVGFIEQISLTEILIAAVVGGLLSMWLGRSHFEAKLSAQAVSWSNVMRMAEIAGITFVGQVMVLACFVLGVLAVHPSLDTAHVFAAAAVISFAATLPITVNGWGVREMAAVYVLGKLGVPAADAVTVSVMVGICSMLVIFCVAPFSFKGNEVRPLKTSESQITRPVIEIEKIAAWVIGMCASVAIFFQAYIALPGGVVNLNLADPFAILALAAVGLHTLFSRQLPLWRLGRFNVALGAISLLLLEGFVKGWLDIGVTQWALGGRLIGWLVLLGYLSAGYLIVAYAGTHGLRRLAETMIATATVVVILQMGFRLLNHWGINLGVHLTPNFEGYAGNRNAFAFQLLATASLLLGYAPVYARHKDGRQRIDRSLLFSLLLGVVLTGLFWTGSRAGIGTGVLLLVGAWFIRFADRKILGLGVVFTVALWACMWLLMQDNPKQDTLLGQVNSVQSPTPLKGADPALEEAVQSVPVQNISVQSSFSNENSGYSDQERWSTYTHALELWRQSPLLGAGLGVFIAKSPAWLGHAQVIHSTPLWILAEFGLVGIAVLGSVFILIARYAWMTRQFLPARRILLMLLAVFAVFGLTHEIFYQRVFWLVLGALLAKPFAYRISS